MKLSLITQGEMGPTKLGVLLQFNSCKVRAPQKSKMDFPDWGIRFLTNNYVNYVL